MTTEFHPILQPSEVPIRDKEDAMGAYLMMFAAISAGLPLPIINLIAAVVYYYVNKKKSLFIQFHCLQALLSQLPTTLLNAVAVFAAIRIYIFQTDIVPRQVFYSYLIFIVVLNLLYFIFNIVAAVKARKGQMYYLPIFGKMAYVSVYRVKEESTIDFINKPPQI